MVVRWRDEDLLVGLVQEVDFEDFVLPKGHVERGETLEQAARREIEEEAGITDLDFLGLLDVKERFNYDKTEWKKTTYFLFAVDKDHYASNRPGSHKWFRMDRLPPLFWPEQMSLLVEKRTRIFDLANAWAK